MVPGSSPGETFAERLDGGRNVGSAKAPGKHGRPHSRVCQCKPQQCPRQGMQTSGVRTSGPDRAPHCARSQSTRPQCRHLPCAPGHSERSETSRPPRNVWSAQGWRASFGSAGIASGGVRSAELGRAEVRTPNRWVCSHVRTSKLPVPYPDICTCAWAHCLAGKRLRLGGAEVRPARPTLAPTSLANVARPPAT